MIGIWYRLLIGSSMCFIKLVWIVVVVDRYNNDDDDDEADNDIVSMHTPVDSESGSELRRWSSWLLSDDSDPVPGRLHRQSPVPGRWLEHVGVSIWLRCLLDPHRRKQSATSLLYVRCHTVRAGQPLYSTHPTYHRRDMSVSLNGLLRSTYNYLRQRSWGGYTLCSKNMWLRLRW